MYYPTWQHIHMMSNQMLVSCGRYEEDHGIGGPGDEPDQQQC